MFKKLIITFLILSILLPQNFSFAQDISATENTAPANDALWDSLTTTDDSISATSDSTPENNFVYSPLTGFEFSQGDSIGDAIKQMVMSTILNSVMSVVSGEVPTKGKDVSTAITKTFTESFKQQLVTIKNDIRKMINESGDYIMQRIFATTLQRVTSSLSKLQIKNPELYKALNTYGGLVAGMTMYSQGRCIDPAIMSCVSNAIRSTLTPKRKELDQKAEKGLKYSADIIVKNLKPCPESKIIDDELGEAGDTIGRKNTGEKFKLSTLFKKIPFFADVFKTRSGKFDMKSGNGLAQVGTLGDIANRSSTPTNSIGSFVDTGLKNNLTAMMCQDAVSGLVAMASSEAAKRLQTAEENTKTGFKPKAVCIEAVDGNTNIDPDSPNCIAQSIETPASTLEQMAGWASTAEGNSLIARMNDPHGVNVVSGWFKNWAQSKMDNILNKGFTKASTVYETKNNALSQLSTKANAEKACADVSSIGGGNLGSQLKSACVDAYRAQATIGAEFDKSQNKNTATIRAKTLTQLITLQNNFNAITNPSNFNEKITSNRENISDETNSEFIELSKVYGDLNTSVSDIYAKLGGITQNANVTSALETIQQLNSPTSSDIIKINALRKEVGALSSEISTKQSEYQKQLSIINQKLAGSGLYELFFEKITCFGDCAHGETTNIVGANPKNPAIFYQTPIDSNSPGLTFNTATHDLVFFLNQDLSPDKQTLKNSGLLQSTLNRLSEILDESYAPTTEDIAQITELKKYFNTQNNIYKNLKKYIYDMGWSSQVSGFTNIYSTQNIAVGSISTQATEIIFGASDLLNKIVQLDILGTIRRVGEGEAILQESANTHQNKINTAFDELNATLSADGVNFSAKESELNDISGEITGLNLETDLLKTRIDNFDIALNIEIQKTQQQNLPTEEPSSKSPTKPKIGFIQKAFAIINAPIKLIKGLLGNVLELINSRRVKLK